MVILHTSLGPIHLELEKDKVPVTCENFLTYVNSGFFTNTIFHRVIDGFMIQGGGLSEDMQDKPSKLAPIANEADKGISNLRGTIAMARTMDPNSATSQFFINHKDNLFLNHRSKSLDGWGYCAFGTVTKGMEVVDAIAKVKTTNRRGHSDVPVEPIFITKVEVVEHA